jgi:low affinity Fe/Cu permease
MSGDPRPPHRCVTYLSAAARIVVAGAGSAVVASVVVLLVVTWAVIGVAAGFNQQWLSLLYAASGAITLIMVFLIQHTTGVQTRAVLLKLDELVRATKGARNDVIAAEQLPLHEQKRLEERVARIGGGSEDRACRRSR